MGFLAPAAPFISAATSIAAAQQASAVGRYNQAIQNRNAQIAEQEAKRIEQRKILEKRSDDDFHTILKRYDIYMKETKPVLDFYSSKRGFYEVDGNLNIEQITNKIDDILKL